MTRRQYFYGTRRHKATGNFMAVIYHYEHGDSEMTIDYMSAPQFTRMEQALNDAEIWADNHLSYEIVPE